MTVHGHALCSNQQRRIQIESALIEEVRKGRVCFTVSDIAEIADIPRGAVREDISALTVQSEKLTIRLWTAGTHYVWKISEKSTEKKSLKI